MTKTKQDQRARPAAVELRDAALDRAAGGGFTGGITVASGDINASNSSESGGIQKLGSKRLAL